MLKALGPDLGREVSWKAPTDPKPEGELGELFARTPNIHKMLHYLPAYESTFAPLRSRPVRMLEIGVDRGGSLQMWRSYLPKATIIGVDIESTCQQFDSPAQGVHVRIGDQADTGFLQAVIDELGPFDVVLDDGSHMTSHIVDTFRYLFTHGVAPGGVYMIEDLHSNCWPSHRDSRMSFPDFTKWLIDAMHAHYQTSTREVDFRVGGEYQVNEHRVPLATTLVEKIEFYDSIAVVHRATGSREVPASVRHEDTLP